MLKPYLSNIVLALLTFLLTISLLLGGLEMVLNNETIQTEILGVYGEYPDRLVPTLNSFGFRDDEHQVEKPPGIVRIVVLGDSVTYGQGVADNEIYPRLLAEYAGPRVEIILLAKQGWSTADELEALREIGLNYDPDLVVIGAFENDPEPHQSLPDGLPPNWRVLTAISKDMASFNFVDYNINRLAEDWGWRRPSYFDWQYSLYEPDGLYWPAWKVTVDEMAKLASDHELPIFVFTLPDAVPPGSEMIEQFYYASLSEGFSTAGFFTIDLWPILMQEFSETDYKSLWALPNDPHPGPELHEFYAQQIWKVIEPEVKRLLAKQS